MQEVARLAAPPGLLTAFRRARAPIVASAATYVTFVILGIAMATAGWQYAVDQRDSIVEGAQSSAITQANQKDDHLEAALRDFSSNLIVGALPASIAGLTVVAPFPIAAYRGWIGGIVSIDANHQSRLAKPGSAAYYLVTLCLQLAGYVLTMAAGVHIGLSVLRSRKDASIRSIGGLRIPWFAFRDATYLYVVAIPIFLVGSLWEFLA